MKIFDIKLILILFFLGQFAFGQLSNFSLIVNKTDENCNANGTLTFNVSGTTSGATVLYSIFLLPNTTTPIALLNTNSFAGLVAGNYRIIATQSLGNQTGTQQEDISILNQIVPLAYQIQSENEICGNDGKIVINVNSGNAVQYEIFSGPILKPLQTSNIFTGLIAGQYNIRVFDSCGNGLVQTFTIGGNPNTAGLEIFFYRDNYSDQCNVAVINISINNAPLSSIKYPLNIKVTVQNPNGGNPTIYNQIINSGGQNLSINQNIIQYPNQFYNVEVKVIDGCAIEYLKNSAIDSNVIPNVFSQNDNCTISTIRIFGATTAVLITAPNGFPITLPFVLPSNAIRSFFLENISINGTYVFQTTDICGVQRLQEVLISAPESNFYVSAIPGCQIGKGSISALFNLQSIVLTAAPSGFPLSIPYNYSSLLDINGALYINNVIPGSYTFDLIDKCGNVATKNWIC